VGGILASRLAVKVGDKLELRVILDMAAQPPALPSPSASTRRSHGAYSLTVRAIVRGAFMADDVVFVDRSFLTDEAGTKDAASLIHVHSDAPANAVPLARELEKAFPEIEARAWAEDSRFLGSAIQGNRALNGISSAMAMIGVAIPVWALLFVSVAQRRREIGLYGALGFGAGHVFAIFLLQALVVGVLGVALGVLGGYGLVQWFLSHPLFQNDSFVIRPALSGSALLQSVATILGTTIAAGVYPALRAARIDPARALRGLV
jgi:ABC-type lipoprotein release transport system permease subunit